MKVIFLDIDGVVNPPFIDENLKVRYFTDFSDHAVSGTQQIRWVNKLIKDTEAKVVISSTWRHNFELCKECLINSGFKGEIIDKTPDLFSLSRGFEIDLWLEEHKVDNYVILDDDSDMLDYQQSHFVKCNGNYGFLVPEYIKAKKILETN